MYLDMNCQKEFFISDFLVLPKGNKIPQIFRQRPEVVTVDLGFSPNSMDLFPE